MIIRQMHVNEADKIRQIDRSEQIDRIYKMNGGQLETVPMGHECPTWDEEHTDEMVNRFRLSWRREARPTGRSTAKCSPALACSDTGSEAATKTSCRWI